MNAGRFDSLVEIWRYTTSVDANTGEHIKEWVKLSDAWAHHEPADGGSEGVYADTRENKQMVNFTIRHTSVGVKDRIKYNNQNFNIISTKGIDRDMYIKLMTQLTE